jgi:hypothetical protein
LYLDLHKYVLQQQTPTYILGPKKIVEEFQGCEAGFWRKLKGCLEFPFTQATHDGWMFTKMQNFKLPFGHNDSPNSYYSDYGPMCLAPFPATNWAIDEDFYIHEIRDCDVFYSTQLVEKTTHNFVVHTLDNLALETDDYFVPMYHNIIDPNLTSVKQDNTYRWTATEIIVEEIEITTYNTICSLQLCLNRRYKRIGKYIISGISKLLKDKKIPKANIATPLSNISIDNVELYVAAEQILNAALPLLGKLTKPALLLPGRLQAVVKAQRIYLKPGEEYDGLWHRDGLHEDIVAVVIYYYRVSNALIGGDLEFIDKRPIKEEMGLYGDCDTDDFTTKEAETNVKEIPKCKVPVNEGTLVVFSNYQNIHRVLKMTCNNEDEKSPDGCASRDFLLFFIVDQAKPLTTTNADLTINDDRKKVRKDMFKEQIKPSGMFVPNTNLVSSTGNGCMAQVGWLDGEITYDFEDETLYLGGYRTERSGFKNVEKMNENPPLHRGLSWAFD